MDKIKRKELQIKDIPAILWGDPSNQLFVAVHGNMSHKADDVIILLAEEATEKGYQVLSFDLPEHGNRKNEGTLCKVQNCVADLGKIMRYAKSLAKDTSIFACSMGAYFSLLSYYHESLKQCLFLSPIVDMKRVIENMMKWFNITEERLQAEQEISTSVGSVLYWDYYCYVKEHPITEWKIPTFILYGSDDNLSELDRISAFARQYQCDLQVLEHGEHYFHTPEQLRIYREWLRTRIIKEQP